MRFVIAMAFFVHGFAHTVGFVVPWKIASLDEAPYKTTLLNNKFDVGHMGIRVVGTLWLLAALAFFAAGALVLGRYQTWQTFALIVSLLSTVLCVLGLPESKIGIPINIVIFVLVIAGRTLGWFDAIGI